MKYYKYLSPERIDVLENLKIRYSQVSAMNDPFEMLPAVVAPDGDQQRADRFQRRFRSICDTATGLLCLSKTCENILMWSHYSSSHRGFVIEFDAHHEYFQKGTQEVRYSRNRPRMVAVGGDHYFDIHKTKSHHWSYEKEVRKTMPLHDRIQPLPNGHSIVEGYPDQPENPSKLYLFDYPKEAVTSIILGWKSEPCLKQGVVAALNKHAMNYVRLLQALPCKVEYRMKIYSANQP